MKLRPLTDVLQPIARTVLVQRKGVDEVIRHRSRKMALQILAFLPLWLFLMCPVGRAAQSQQSDATSKGRQAINPNLSEEAVERMLVQHLLTERIFRKIFDNPDFTRRNVVAAEIEKASTNSPNAPSTATSFWATSTAFTKPSSRARKTPPASPKSRPSSIKFTSASSRAIRRKRPIPCMSFNRELRGEWRPGRESNP